MRYNMKEVTMSDSHQHNPLQNPNSVHIFICIIILLISIIIPASAYSTVLPKDPEISLYHQEMEQLLTRFDIATAYVFVIKNNEILSAEGYGCTEPAEILGIDARKEYEIASEITLIQTMLVRYLSLESVIPTTKSLLNAFSDAKKNEGLGYSPGDIMQMIGEPEMLSTRYMNWSDIAKISQGTKGNQNPFRIVSLSQPISFSYQGHTVIDQSWTTPGVRGLITRVPDEELLIAIIISEEFTPLPEVMRGKILNKITWNGNTASV